jgi:hypothetical protein
VAGRPRRSRRPLKSRLDCPARSGPLQAGELEQGSGNGGTWEHGKYSAHVRLISKSVFCKVHAPLTSRLSIRRIIATLMNVSLLCTIRSIAPLPYLEHQPK